MKYVWLLTAFLGCAFGYYCGFEDGFHSLLSDSKKPWSKHGALYLYKHHGSPNLASTCQADDVFWQPRTDADLGYPTCYMADKPR